MQKMNQKHLSSKENNQQRSILVQGGPVEFLVLENKKVLKHTPYTKAELYPRDTGPSCKSFPQPKMGHLIKIEKKEYWVLI